MIVVSMTTEEIYREIMRDFGFVNRKGNVEGNILFEEMRRKRLSHETRSICYKTPHRNEWTITFQMDNTTGIQAGYYLKTYDAKGMVAYMIQFVNPDTPQAERFVKKYCGHFFERYNERMHLGLTDYAKVIKHFFKNNLDYSLGETNELIDNIRCLHYIYKEGMGIGWQNDAKKTIHMKTFISNDMLTANQLNLADHIKYKGEDEKFDVVIKEKHLDTTF